MELKKLSYSSALRTWIGVTSLMGFGDTIQCFVDHKFLTTHLFINAQNEVSGLTARCFGILMLISATLRFICAMDIHNKILYNVALFSFLASFLHFFMEVSWYKTATLYSGIVTPLLVSGLSVLAMLLGYKFLGNETNECSEIDEFGGKIFRKKKKKLTD